MQFRIIEDTRECGQTRVGSAGREGDMGEDDTHPEQLSPFPVLIPYRVSTHARLNRP